MRNFLFRILGVLTLIGAVVAQSPLSPTPPATEQVTATKEKWKSLATGMTFDEVVAVMGEPSQVDDLQKEFYGLSPGEDSFLVPNRSRLSKRAVWYVKKIGRTPNLNDEWFTAYFSRTDEKLVGKLSNPPDAK
jgi:hypothetical protein